MKYFIKEKQLKNNISKFGFQTYDDKALQSLNKFQQRMFEDLAKHVDNKQKKQQRQQKGGRVAMPLPYFTGQDAQPVDTPFTDVSANDAMLRQEMNLNDPTNVLATEKALQPFVGGKGPRKYELSQKAAIDTVNETCKVSKVELSNKKKFITASKQKFEDVATEVFGKLSRQGKTHLTGNDLDKILNMKKYSKFSF